MAATKRAVVESTDRELSITRDFAAPRALVFRLWTDAKSVAAWWGPAGFTNPVCKVDARPGGGILIHMRAPDGTIHPMAGAFRELVAPERLVFTTTVDDADGRRIVEARNTVTFVEHDGRTTLTLHATAAGFGDLAAEMLARMDMGWRQSLERLDALLVKQPV